MLLSHIRCLSGLNPSIDMRTCAGAGVALYGCDSPFPEGLLLHRLFEEMLAKQGSEVGEKVGDLGGRFECQKGWLAFVPLRSL